MTQPNSPEEPRRREHPDVRFAPPQHQFDLRAAAQELWAGPSTAAGKHRQKTLYRYGRVTIALFAFEAGAGLPQHTAAGVVTINVLDGKLRVRAAGVEHVLPAGNLLVLASRVVHDVTADERSTMLLQVHLDEPSASAAASTSAATSPAAAARPQAG